MLYLYMYMLSFSRRRRRDVQALKKTLERQEEDSKRYKSAVEFHLRVSLIHCKHLSVSDINNVRINT